MRILYLSFKGNLAEDADRKVKKRRREEKLSASFFVQ